MPGWREFLNDEEVADLLTYIRSSWGNDASAVSPEEVEIIREATQGLNTMWIPEELKKEENRGIPGINPE